MSWRLSFAIAFMRDGIRQTNFTSKPRFETAGYKFYRGQIPKAAKMKRIPSCEQLEGI